MSQPNDLGRAYHEELTATFSYKRRISQGESMSLAEFLYPMMQAWDWWHLYNTEDVKIQVGGSDQFGNILAGAEGVNFVRKLQASAGLKDVQEDFAKDSKNAAPTGFTVPLLTTSRGKKFGKSDGNVVWLDPTMTSPFKFYQVWLFRLEASMC